MISGWRDWATLGLIAVWMYTGREELRMKWRVITGKEQWPRAKSAEEYEQEIVELKQACNEYVRDYEAMERFYNREALMLDQARVALRAIRSDVNECFVSCPNCGHEIDLKDLDCMIAAAKAADVHLGKEGAV